MTEQHVKINLSANAIRSLLMGNDPQALVQITEKATALVAVALARRWEKKRIDETVERIEYEINNRLERWATMPAEIREPVVTELRLIIGREVHAAVTSLVNKAIGEHIQKLIDSQAKVIFNLVEQKALKMVEDRVNDRVLALIKTAMKG